MTTSVKKTKKTSLTGVKKAAKKTAKMNPFIGIQSILSKATKNKNFYYPE